MVLKEVPVNVVHQQESREDTGRQSRIINELLMRDDSWGKEDTPITSHCPVGRFSILCSELNTALNRILCWCPGRALTGQTLSICKTSPLLSSLSYSTGNLLEVIAARLHREEGGRRVRPSSSHSISHYPPPVLLSENQEFAGSCVWSPLSVWISVKIPHNYFIFLRN